MSSTLVTQGTFSIRRLVVPVLAILISASGASAQVTASLSGTVEDRSGAVIPGAQVTVQSEEKGFARVVTTDEGGRYRVLSLPVGQYRVKAEKDAFKAQVRQGITLTVAQEAVVNFSLEVGTMNETVTVTGEAPGVNTTTTSTAGLVGERAVKELPLNGRSFDNLITLNPGTVSSTTLEAKADGGSGNTFSISGRRPAENIYLLNGIEYIATSGLDLTPGGASGQMLGIDAIREFNVLKDSYSAEYGKRPGGQISIVTASGTNAFHGTLFEFLRNSALDARNFFDQGNIPPFERNSFGGSGGGPLRKDKTFIFGNYEGFRERLNQTSKAIVPDNNARKGLLPDPQNPGRLVDVGLSAAAAPYLALFPVANGPELGSGAAVAFSNPKQVIREDFFTTRVDHSFSERDTFNSVYTFDDGRLVSASVANPLSGDFKNLRSQVLSMEYTHLFSAHFINTARVGFTRSKFFFDSKPLIDFPSSLSFVPGRPLGQIKIGGGIGATAASFALAGADIIAVDNRLARNLFTYEEGVQITRGRHLIATGLWFQRVQSNDDAAGIKSGQMVFASLTTFLQGKASSFVLGSINPTEIGWRQLEGAWYVQDTIKLRPSLTLNLGLRHEFTDGWNAILGRASNFVYGPGGILQSDPVVGSSVYRENNSRWLFGPRLGVAWDPFGRGKTSIHAGVGMYYGLLDTLAFCCDGTAPVNTRISLSNVTLPFSFTPATPLPVASLTPQGLDPAIKTPTVISYTFRVEQAISPSTTLSVAYVGSHGYHAPVATDANTAFPTLANGQKSFPPNSPKRNPKLASARYFLGVASSSYQALQAELNRRFGRGLTFRLNYAYSKSIDTSSQIAKNQGINAEANLLDPEDPARDRALSDFDNRNRLSFSGSYDLPLGRGKAFLSNASGWAGKLVSGWQWNTILTLQNGFPFTPVLGFNRSRNGDARAPDRPDLVPGFDASGIILGSPNRYFNASAFVLPPAGTYGNAGRNILIGPGLADLDVSLFKITQLTEKLGLQFRAETFNILNRANFGVPQRILFNSDGTRVSTTGVITSTSTTSRQIQVALKLIW